MRERERGRREKRETERIEVEGEREGERGSWGGDRPEEELAGNPGDQIAVTSAYIRLECVSGTDRQTHR